MINVKIMLFAVILSFAAIEELHNFGVVFLFQGRNSNQKGKIKFRHCINSARELTYCI